MNVLLSARSRENEIRKWLSEVEPSKHFRRSVFFSYAVDTLKNASKLPGARCLFDTLRYGMKIDLPEDYVPFVMGTLETQYQGEADRTLFFCR
jgi:hypothetical protein